MPFGLSPVHLIVALVIAVVLIGPRRLPQLGGLTGRRARELKEIGPATRDAFMAELQGTPVPDTPPPADVTANVTPTQRGDE
jgi:Sec-independent protein translocase protein TatA